MRILKWILSLLGDRIWSWLAPFMMWIIVGAGVVAFMVFAQSWTAMKAIGTVLQWSIWLVGLPLATIASIVEKAAAWRAEVTGKPIAKLRPIVAGYITLAAVIAYAVLSVTVMVPQPGPGPGPGPGPQPGPGPGPSPDPEPWDPQPEPWDPTPAPTEWDTWYTQHKQDCRQCSRPILPMCREARDKKRELSQAHVWTPN